MKEWVLSSRYKIILVGLLIPILPLVMLAGYIYYTLSDDIGQLLINNVTTAAENTAARIESQMAHDIATAQLFATRPHLLNAIQAGDLQTMNMHLKNYVDQVQHMDRATIVDTKGIQLANYPFDPQTIGMDFSHRDYFRGVTERRAPYISEFFMRTAEPKRYVFSVSVPIKKDGNPIGILNLQPKADYFKWLLGEVPLAEGQKIIVDSKGYLVYSSLEKAEITDPKDLSALPLVRELMLGREGLAETIDTIAMETNEPAFTAYRRIGTYGWGLIIDVPKQEAMAPLRGILAWLLAVTLLMLLAGGYFGYRWATVLDHEKQTESELRHKSEALAVLNNQLTEVNSEMEQLNRQLIEASAAKSKFLSNMSHELRTPLNSIIGFSQLLEDGFAGELNEKQKEYVSILLSSGSHLLSLINDVLDLAKVEAGRMELELSRFQAKGAIEAATTYIHETCKEKRIRLEVCIEPEADIEIEADDKKFKQILLNLLSNAVKFTPEGGAVTVSVRRSSIDEGNLAMAMDSAALPQKELLEISVSDTGIGIKPEDLPKLFQPFSQLDSEYTKKYAGTGLGLALVKMLVALHGGKVGVESVFGKGSIFTIAVPILQSGKNTDALL